MHLPEELQTAIESIVQNAPTKILLKAQEELSKTYKRELGSNSIFSDPSQALAYLAARMPATYAAVHAVLEKIGSNYSCGHFLDLGAGPGTASWAATEIFPSLEKVTLVETNSGAIGLGKSLSNFSSQAALKGGEWLQRSLLEPLPEADVAVLSYVLGELAHPEKFVEQASKFSVIAIIEPGTPKGFSGIRKIRERFIDLGFQIVAPCPHHQACPIQGNDWCHFSARVERTRLHRQLKKGALGHEDEKFSYLIVAKVPGVKFGNRIIRRPLKQSGHTRLFLCTDLGNLEERVVTRSDKELYRSSRDAEWGDSWM